MDKISNQQVSGLLRDAAATLRKTASERDHYQQKCAAMERRQQAEKLASVMHEKGLDLDISSGDLADRLEKAAENGKLETLQQAVDFIGPNMSERIGKLASDDSRQMLGSELERYLSSGAQG